MKHYSRELYSKLKSKVLRTLENDEFQDYFTQVLESGVRTYGQKNEKLIKIIDEKWVNALHDTIPALDEIINKPRKFIEREEVIVPVELARKVGADSVKHLATHTQFISQVDPAGNIIPSKIMNIYNEESFNMYENRFIITLIQRANDFVDLRYDAVMEMTGDEFQSALKVNSDFADNGEDVEYRLSFKVHQGPEYLGSENNNAELLKKIAHIRLMYTSFKRTEFYQALAGCTLVKSPISRTNLMTKNRLFKQCYELWGFLERYTETGYSVEQHESDGNFDPEYVEELNSLIMFNYLIVKNNMENEFNKATEIDGKKLTVIKPKFQNEIVGETAPNYDISRPELKEVPEESVSHGTITARSPQGMILVALAKFLHDEQIITALEKALFFELNKKKRDKTA